MSVEIEHIADVLVLFIGDRRMCGRETHLEELPPGAERGNALSLETRVGHDNHVAPLDGLEIGRVFLVGKKEKSRAGQSTGERDGKAKG